MEGLSERPWGELPGCSAGFILGSHVRVSWKGTERSERGLSNGSTTPVKEKLTFVGLPLCARPCVNFFMYISLQLFLKQILRSILTIILPVMEVLH